MPTLDDSISSTDDPVEDVDEAGQHDGRAMRMRQVHSHTCAHLQEMQSMGSSDAEAPPGSIRLIKLDSFLTWEDIQIYERVDPVDCEQVPYERDTSRNQVWDNTVVVSWQWSSFTRPESPSAVDASPMQNVQFRYLTVCLESIKQKDPAIQYVWIDWCCMPQFPSCSLSSPDQTTGLDAAATTNLEKHRSKLYYAWAKRVIMVPQFREYPGTETAKSLRGVLYSTSDDITEQIQGSVSSPVIANDSAPTLEAVDDLIKRVSLPDSMFWGRAWTLVERMARTAETLSKMIPDPEVFLGMIIDVLVNPPNENDLAAVETRLNPIVGSSIMDSIKKLLDMQSRMGKQIETSNDFHESLWKVLDDCYKLWARQKISQPAPDDRSWLETYLKKDAGVAYQTTDPEDLVWAVYSYGCPGVPKTRYDSLMALGDLGLYVGATDSRALGDPEQARPMRIWDFPRIVKDIAKSAVKKSNLASCSCLIEC